MLKRIYGTIQGAIQWWRKCCKAMYYLKWQRHDVDPFLFVKWDDVTHKLIVFLLWVDDCCMVEPKENMIHEAKQFSNN